MKNTMINHKTLLLSVMLLVAVGCGKSKDNKTPAITGVGLNKTLGTSSPTTVEGDSVSATLRGNDQSNLDILTDDEWDQTHITPAASSGSRTASRLPVLPKAPTFRGGLASDDSSTPSGRKLLPLADGSEDDQIVDGRKKVSDRAQTSQPSLKVKPVVPSSVKLLPLSSNPRTALEDCFDLNLILFNEVRVKTTGGVFNDKAYSTAGNDHIVESLRKSDHSMSAEQKKANHQLAGQIVAARLLKAVSGQPSSVDLIIEESGKQLSYKFEVKKINAKNKLFLKSAAGNLKFEGGQVKCLDADGECDVSYVKMKLSGAYIFVVFRNLFVDRFFEFDQNDSLTEFNLWKKYIKNTVLNAPTAEKIKHVQTSTFEIINGRSSMGLLLLTEDHHAMGLNIPLLVSKQGGTQSGVEATQRPDIAKFYSFKEVSSNYKERLARALRTIVVEKNNGKGQLKIKMHLTDDVTQKIIFKMIISPIQKDIITERSVLEFEVKQAL